MSILYFKLVYLNAGLGNQKCSVNIIHKYFIQYCFNVVAENRNLLHFHKLSYICNLLTHSAFPS